MTRRNYRHARARRRPLTVAALVLPVLLFAPAAVVLALVLSLAIYGGGAI